MSTKFKVNRDLRGELTLPTLEHKMLTSNSVIHLSDDQLKNPHIRMAIRSGTLIIDSPVEEVVEEVVEMEKEEMAEKVVEVKETVKKKRGRKKKIAKEEDVVEKITEVEPEAEEVDEAEIAIDLEENRLNEPKTNMSAWNPESGEMINKEDSMKKVLSDLNGVDMTVQSSSKDEAVDFEKEIDKTTDALKKSFKKKIPTINSPTTKKFSKSKRLKPIGKKRDLSNMIGDEFLSNEGSLVDEGDLSFVDVEQDRERASSRLPLKETQ